MARLSNHTKVVMILASVTMFLILFSHLITPVVSSLIEPYWDAGECEECHGGFEPFHITPDSPSGVVEGSEFDYRLNIENPWTHELRNVQVKLDLSGAPNIQSTEAGGDTQVEYNSDGNIGAGNQISGEMEVPPGATEILVQMYYVDPALFIGDLAMAVDGPSGGFWTSDLSDTTEVIRIGQSDLESEGYGTYRWSIISEASVRSVEYHLTAIVTFSGGTMVSTTVEHIGSMEETTVEFKLTSSGKGENSVRYMVSAEAYHEHNGNPPDSDVYDADGDTTITVGDTYSYQKPTSKLSTAQTLWYIGRFMAFVTTIMFIISFLTGGSIKSVREYMDKRFNNRGKVHCNVSKLVFLTALIHLIVLYAGLYSGTYKGIFLGGLSLILMLVLAITGALKRKITEKWGVKAWRRVHFWLSVVILVLIVIHAVKEGTDLAFLRVWE